MKAIDVRDLVVRYKTTHSTPTLRRWVASSSKREIVTALDGVTFSVERGEAFGIIGPNGAGKSTLMRVLARTLRPDSGSVEIAGDISTLLQLGVGFNPELSASRNVYLGALAMGMTRAEVDRDYDDIVDFAELSYAMDRPLKTFSSGMKARLAFSISMHMKPSIFLIDEVLAVGDDHFRKKSLEEMERMLENAGTIVFVSHALSSIRSFCNRALWLEGGKVKMIGDPDEVVDSYQASGVSPARRQR